MLEEARTVLRKRFLEADVGLTGANMIIAETGTVVVVSNAGNAALTMRLPQALFPPTNIPQIMKNVRKVSMFINLRQYFTKIIRMPSRMALEPLNHLKPSKVVTHIVHIYVYT